MFKQLYVRSDGNGGVNASHMSMALISIVLVILGMAVNAGLGYGQIDAKVERLEIDSSFQGEKIIEHAESLASIETNIIYIRENIDDIKDLLKKS